MHDPELVVSVANVLHDQTSEPMWSCVVIARAVLDAVADPLRAEGAKCRCTAQGGGVYDAECPRHAGSQDALFAAYQRGMVEGARQVYKAAGRESVRSGADIIRTMDAAREAVARIEQAGE